MGYAAHGGWMLSLPKEKLISRILARWDGGRTLITWTANRRTGTQDTRGKLIKEQGPRRYWFCIALVPHPRTPPPCRACLQYTRAILQLGSMMMMMMTTRDSVQVTERNRNNPSDCCCQTP